MSEQDDTGKTRISRSARASSGTGQSRPEPPPANSEKTRISSRSTPARQTPAGQNDDATRISSPGSAAPDDENLEKTVVLKPEAGAPDDATRISAVRRTPVDTDQTVVVPEEQSKTASVQAGAPVAAGKHGLLKNRFMLEKVLGAGGMGVVYKAKDQLKIEAKDRDPYVAIKVLGEDFKDHPEAIISLQRESRKSQRIAHPNIVNVFDFDRDGDTVFMTMEFLDGSPLDELIKRYKETGLPTDDAWTIIHGMSAALSYAHAEKIIHSDFKPGNVFVTRKGLAKVFDFGIARAVANVDSMDMDGDGEDKTMFDAGDLGALTPAYASLEMLTGQEPDVRDDIYALGCVAYELFTGRHPFNKTPAHKAMEQGMKPEPITSIKKYQWQAIERALAFKREDRIATVDEFIEAISPKLKTSNKMATGLALLLSVVITTYFLFFQDNQPDPLEQFNLRNELELEIKTNITKENLEAQLKKPDFSPAWQDTVWKNISDLVILTRGEDPWVDEKKKQVYQLYLDEIARNIKAYKYTTATALIENARRYTDDAQALDKQVERIARARKRNLIKRSEPKVVEVEKPVEAEKADESKKAVDSGAFDVALNAVNKQLACRGRLNMRNFESSIQSMRRIDMARYKHFENEIVKSLAKCISQSSKNFPERAADDKKRAMRIFKSNATIAAISIQSRDPCSLSLAGQGGRSNRSVCKDKLKTGGSGPTMVVIPAKDGIKPFAIGKYEVSVKEMNAFCAKSSRCEKLPGDSRLPATGISLKVIKAYLKYLTKNTGYKYRLPSRAEWMHAAKTTREKLDANRNCSLSMRGIQKGGKLVKVNVGKKNRWGLVNYVGNARELVYDTGRRLVAVGGSFKQEMQRCRIDTVQRHNGKADDETGFRVLRQIRQ